MHAASAPRRTSCAAFPWCLSDVVSVSSIFEVPSSNSSSSSSSRSSNISSSSSSSTLPVDTLIRDALPVDQVFGLSEHHLLGALHGYITLIKPEWYVRVCYVCGVRTATRFDSIITPTSLSLCVFVSVCARACVFVSPATCQLRRNGIRHQGLCVCVREPVCACVC